MFSSRIRRWVQNVRTFTRSLRGVSRVEKELGLRNTRKIISPRERVERMKKLERLKKFRGGYFSLLEKAHHQLRQHIHEQGIPSFVIEPLRAQDKNSEYEPKRLCDAVAFFVQDAIKEYKLTGKPFTQGELPFHDNFNEEPRTVGGINFFYDGGPREFTIVIRWDDVDSAKNYRENLYPEKGAWYSKAGKLIWILHGNVSPQDEKAIVRGLVKEKMVGKKREKYFEKYRKND